MERGRKPKTSKRKHRSFMVDTDVYDAFTKICDEQGFIYSKKVTLILEAWVKEQKNKGRVVK